MLRIFLSLFVVFLVTFSLMMSNAEAGRFGGGRSFGMQRSVSSFRSSPSNSFSQSRSAFGQTGSTASRWLLPMAGLAIGGILGSLFFGHGMGSAMLAWLGVGLVIMFLLNLYRNRMQPMRQSSPNSFNQAFQHAQPSSPFAANQPLSAVNHSPSYPRGFDEAAFLRDAKVQFIRLQAAYDEKNVDDLREFTTPEVFAEIKLQWQERGNAENRTDVISLEATLLDVTPEFQKIGGMDLQSMLATVRFEGMIQENRQAPAEPFNELWHFRKDVANKWVVAGLQQ